MEAKNQSVTNIESVAGFSSSETLNKVSQKRLT